MCINVLFIFMELHTLRWRHIDQVKRPSNGGNGDVLKNRDVRIITQHATYLVYVDLTLQDNLLTFQLWIVCSSKYSTIVLYILYVWLLHTRNLTANDIESWSQCWIANFVCQFSFSRKGYNCTSLTAATHKGMYDDVGGGGVMRVRGWEADSLCMSLMSDELSLRTSRTRIFDSCYNNLFLEETIIGKFKIY